MTRWLMRFAFVAVLALLFSTHFVAAARAAAGEDAVAERFEKSYAAESEGDYGRALNEVLEILRGDTSDYVATLRAAWLYYNKGQHEDAIATYRKAVSLASRSVEARLGLTLPLMALGRWEETEKVCREVLAIAPSDYTAKSRLAFALFSREAFVAAEQAYREVLELYPSVVDMRLGLGWTHLKRGRKDLARQEFERVLRVARTNLSARAGLEACQ